MLNNQLYKEIVGNVARKLDLQTIVDIIVISHSVR